MNCIEDGFEDILKLHAEELFTDKDDEDENLTK